MTSFCRFRKLILPLVSAIFFLAALTSYAQAPTVYGVFFYSPTCPHCQDVINNHWPAIQSEFGDQLHVLFINVTTQEGSQVMQAAISALRIQSNGVPMLIIGSDVLVGSVDIPVRAPGVIRAGLDTGGVGLPAIPGIQALYDAALEQTSQTQTETQASVPPKTEETQTWVQRLALDPVANGLSVLILVLLTLSLVNAIRLVLSKRSQNEQLQIRQHQHIALTLVSLLGLGMSLSLLAGWSDNATVLLLAAGEVVIFLIVVAANLRALRERTVPQWLIPLTAIGGVAVAGYLAYIELTLVEAVCGVVGNCNTVQQSQYARVLNVPIGVLGIAGYCLIIVIWLLSREGKLQLWANELVRYMVMFGVLFSIYLTFLEPFVIGATCIWCLTSAVIMLILLWLLIPSIPEREQANAHDGASRVL